MRSGSNENSMPRREWSFVEVQDKIVFITGAGTGIGRAVALALAEEGAYVAISDVNLETAEETAKLVREKGRHSLAFKVDVTKRADIEKAVEATVEEFGRLDVMVNNAGVSTINKAIDLTEEEWDFNMDVNAKGVFFGCQVAAKQLIKQGQGGKIINTASMAGKMGVPLLAHYAASKWAVLGLTQTFALELAPYGITVNAVCPGYVRTGMQSREVEWEAQLLGKTPDEVLQSYVDKTPLGRLETPEDVAQVFVFLVSKRSNFMTGQAINVTGGVRMD